VRVHELDFTIGFPIVGYAWLLTCVLMLPAVSYDERFEAIRAKIIRGIFKKEMQTKIATASGDSLKTRDYIFRALTVFQNINGKSQIFPGVIEMFRYWSPNSLYGSVRRYNMMK